MRRPARVVKPEFIGPIQPVWQRYKFPTLDLKGRFPGTKHSLEKPYCWTPTTPFYWGGKQFVWGYPCIAFETSNFGWISQKGPHGRVTGRY